MTTNAKERDAALAEVQRYREMISEIIGLMAAGFDGFEDLAEEFHRDYGDHLTTCSLSRGGKRCSCGWNRLSKEKAR